MSLITCSSAIVDSTLQCSTKCSFTTISAALASGATTIHIKAGIYNESISVSNVTIESDNNVFINGISVLNGTIIGGTYTGLTIFGSVNITNAVVSLVNNGILEITKSKILSLTNNNCASIYNNYIFAPIVSTGGTLNVAENIFCSVNNLLSATNTTARVLSNTIISNLPNFIAYDVDDTSIVQSSNNTFRVLAPNTISNNDNVRTNDDVWTSDFPTNNNTLNGYNTNGNNVIDAQYGSVINTTTAYATTPNDYVINVLAPGGNVTLTTPPTDGQVIFVKNNSGSSITVNGVVIPNGDGAIFTYANGAWQLIGSTASVVPPPVPPFFVNNSVFVDSTFGNNTTAQPNNPALPASTIEYAVSIAPTPTAMIYVQPGTYTPVTGFTTNNFMISPDATINWAINDVLFGGISNVYGEGTFNLTGTGTLFGGSGVYIGQVVNQDIASTGAIFSVSDSVVKFNIVNPNNTSIFANTAVDIQQVTITDVSIAFFALANASLRIKYIQGPFTGGLNSSIITAVGSSTVMADSTNLTGTPRNFLLSGDTDTNIDLRVGIINSIAVLIQGTGRVTGYVGSIVSNTISPIISSPNVIVNMRIGSLASTDVSGFSITNSNLVIGRLTIGGTNPTGWDLPNSFLQVNYLTTAVAGGPNTLFNISGTSTMKVGYLTAGIIGNFMTVAGDLDLEVNRAILTAITTNYIIITGTLRARFNKVVTNAINNTFIVNNSVSSNPSTVEIVVYSGGPIVNGTGTSATYSVNLISGANIGYYYFTFSGGNTMDVIVDNILLVTNSSLVNSTAPLDLTFSASGGTSANIVQISDSVTNKVNINSLLLTGAGVSNVITMVDNIGASPQLINVNNADIVGNTLVSYTGTAPIELNIDNIQTLAPIIDMNGVGQDYNININNIVTGSRISGITYFINNTRYRLHVANGIFNAAGVITVTGNSHLLGGNSGVWLNFGNIVANVSEPIQINIDAAVYIDSKLFRSTNGYIVRITNAYGTYVRITGKYASPLSVVYLTFALVNSNLTVEGVYFCQCELISVSEVGFRAEFGVAATFILTYRTRIFDSITTAPAAVISVGAGAVSSVFPIQTFTVYSPLPN